MVYQGFAGLSGPYDDKWEKRDSVDFFERYAFNNNHIIKINKYFGVSEIFKHLSSFIEA